jgi:hypothetical protein
MSVHYDSTHHQVTISNNTTGHHDSVTLNVSGSSSGDFEISSDGHGGTMLDDPATTGNVTIDSDQVLGVSAASSNTVTFANNSGTTGELLLADSKDFTGTISGFAGDGTVANSDLIDVTDLKFAGVATSKTTYTDHGNGTGTLTLYDAQGHALDSINFNGNYQLANFTVEDDGSGNTLIVDPPVSTTDQPPANTTVATNQNSTGTAAPDGFAFNFAGSHNTPASDSHLSSDFLQLGGPMLTNLHVAANSTPEPASSSMPLAGHDLGMLTEFAKAQLNAHDFHFV